LRPVCLCVPVCLQAYLWNHWTDLHDIFCVDPLWSWLSSPLVVCGIAIHCVLQVLWMASRLAVVGRMASIAHCVLQVLWMASRLAVVGRMASIALP